MKTQRVFINGPLRGKCAYWEFFWSVFFRIRTEYEQIRNICPCSVQMWENTDQKNAEFGHFSRGGPQFTSMLHQKYHNLITRT